MNKTNCIRIYPSEELFGLESAIQINHRGVIYTLRITQFGIVIARGEVC